MLADWDPYDQNDFAPFFDPAWMFGDAYLRGGKATEAGFDIVVGNPPYVRQEKIKDQKAGLKPHYPETFTGTADLYVYFYDRAVQLLRSGGILSFISSNKWYRAAYGQKLRAHLGRSATLLHAIDFGDAPVFTAIAYPTIVIARKTTPTPKHAFRALNWDPATPNTEIATFAAFYTAKSSRVAQSSLQPDGWRFMPRNGQELLEKIRAAGTPLGEFVHGRFYYGIKTGLNDAVVVDRATRDRLIAEDPRSEEVLKPFLRGRDVKRWRIEYQDLWLIFTRHGTQIRDYPAILKHLTRYREQLEPRPPNWPVDQHWPGRKPGAYRWYEIQDNVAYWEEFETPKVIYPDIYEHQSFAYDDAGFFAANTTYFIPHETRARVLACLLNSSLVEWFYSQISNRIRGGYLRAFSESMQQIPIPSTNPGSDRAVEEMYDSLCLAARGREDMPVSRETLMSSYCEQILDAMVYELYLPEDVHSAGLHFFDLVSAAHLPRVDLRGRGTCNQAAALREKLEEIYAPSHPLRAAIQKLHTLEPVRIIEGKAS
jgi:hypothetical protein